MTETKNLYIYTLNNKGTIVREDYLVIEETGHYVYYASDNTHTLMAPHIHKNRLDRPVHNMNQYNMYSFSEKVSYVAGIFAQFMKEELEELRKQQNEILTEIEKLEYFTNQITSQYAEIEEVEKE